MTDQDNADSLRVALGSDHEGQPLKDKLVAHLREERYSVKDCGGQEIDPVSGPGVVGVVAQALAAGEVDLGIVVSGSGAVASLLANKIPGVRACHCSDTFSARHARRTVAADILCLGARVVGDELAAEIADVFVAEAPSEDERHEVLRRRIQELEDDFDSNRTELTLVPAPDSGE